MHGDYTWLEIPVPSCMNSVSAQLNYHVVEWIVLYEASVGCMMAALWTCVCMYVQV